MHTDRQMIEALHDKDMAASKTKDLTILMSLWTDDGVALPPGEDPVIGEEALQAWLQRDLEQDRDYQITEYVHSFEEIEMGVFQMSCHQGATHLIECPDKCSPCNFRPFCAQKCVAPIHSTEMKHTQ